MFQKQYNYASRIGEYKRITEKFVDKIPVICEIDNKFNIENNSDNSSMYM